MQTHRKMFYFRVTPTLIFSAFLAAANVFAQAPSTTTTRPVPRAKGVPETTPTSLPGLETHIYRDLKPEPLRLHVAKPRDWKPTDHRPAFIFFFGGGWTSGTPERSATWAKFAASLGMIGIAPDYRTKNRFDTTPLESVSDARAAFHWVEDHAAELGINPSQIVVGGSSAGGHVALWTAIEHTPPSSDPDLAPKHKPCALILLCAVSDTSMLAGYTPKRFGQNAEALSPIHQLDPKMPPMLVFHGDADKTVPQRQSVALRDKLIATSNRCQLVTVPGGDHGFITQLPEWKDKTRDQIKSFLEQQKILPVK